MEASVREKYQHLIDYFIAYFEQRRQYVTYVMDNFERWNELPKILTKINKYNSSK